MYVTSWYGNRRSTETRFRAPTPLHTHTSPYLANPCKDVTGCSSVTMTTAPQQMQWWGSSYGSLRLTSLLKKKKKINRFASNNCAKITFFLICRLHMPFTKMDEVSTLKAVMVGAALIKTSPMTLLLGTKLDANLKFMLLIMEPLLWKIKT